MASSGVCELCGFADDSFRIEENGAVMKVCKFCHDGYLERMGISPEEEQTAQDVALSLDIEEIESAGIDIDGMSGEELLQLKMELEERKEKVRVKTLDSRELDSLLEGTEDDKKVLTGVRQKEQRRKKKALASGLDDDGEDYKASEELIRSGEELQRVVAGLGETDSELDIEGAPLIAKIVAPAAETQPIERAGGEESRKIKEQNEVPRKEIESAKEHEMSDKKIAENAQAEREQSKEEKAREKIRAAAHQSIDDERIRITSPEVALSKDKRPKTNFDVATSENAGSVRFLDAFKYVMHRVSYAVLLGLIVLAVATVQFIREGWQHGLIVFGGGVGAVAVGFLIMWYMSHCYELDRRAQLLRIRQQEILFESMRGDCYRELRTKFTVIKALGWLLSKLSVLLPLVTFVGGNIAAVIVSFVLGGMYWLMPVVSVAASVAGVSVYYLFKFAADCVAYALDRERNQQIQQQTLLDILDELRKNK